MLTSREHQILRAIVNEHIASAQPVGSRLLWARYGLGISPATIRGVMSALTEAGFLEQPHTSAGRVPTDRAYRLFLEGVERSTPSVSEQEKIARRMSKAKTREDAAFILASELAQVGGGIGIVSDGNIVRLAHLSNALGQPEFRDPALTSYLAELLDRTIEWLPKLANQPGKLMARIGTEHDDYRARQVSVVAIQLGKGKQKQLVAVIGPTRMPYRKLASLFEFGAAQLEKVRG